MTWHGCAAQAAPFEEQTKLLCELTKFFLHKSRSLSHHLLATKVNLRILMAKKNMRKSSLVYVLTWFQKVEFHLLRLGVAVRCSAHRLSEITDYCLFH